MKKTFLLLIFALNLAAQSDFNNLSWKFRGPINYNLGVKEVIDIATDPNNTKKLWACTLEDGLLFNNDVIDEKSNWQKSTLAKQRVYKLKFHPNMPLVAFAIGDFVNWKTTDGGKTWSEMTNIQSASRCFDIWVSKVGTVVVATSNEVFMSIDEGRTWKKILETESPRTIIQLWLHENERIYVVKDDYKGLYSDASFSIWSNISFAQMREEGMPFSQLEEFHAYIEQSGRVFHRYNTDRKKILSYEKYSIDGGQNYQFLLGPDKVKETVFVENNLVFATSQGVFVYEATKLRERNKGQLDGEFNMFAIRDFAGDNYFSGITTKGTFMMSNMGAGSAVEAKNQFERYNYITNANPYKGAISYFSNENFLAVEEDKLNYIGNTHLVGKKIIPVTQNISLYLTNKGEIGKWTANTTGNLAEGKTEIFETGASPVKDIYYNAALNTVYGLYKDGKFVRIKNPDASPSALMVKTYFQLPFVNFDQGIIDEISSDGKQILVTDKTNNLWVTTDEGNTWRKINTDAIKDLKINHFEYAVKFQKLFLATETGMYLGEDILGNIPKWTNISKEIGLQPCVFIQFRALDNQLAIMTRYKGIYSTLIFTEPNQIITNSPSYLNLNSPNHTYFTSEKLLVTICDKSKTQIDFTTNIPENLNVDYVVEVSDDAGVFSIAPFILKGSSKKSPVEVEFVKPQDLRRNGFRFRVLARGAIQAIGTATPEIFISSQKEFIATPQNFSISCEKQVVELQAVEGVNNPPYTWEKDGILIAGASNAAYSTSQAGTYTRTAQMNGCVFKSVINLTSNISLKPLLKPNVGISYSGSSCVVDSFKLFTDFNNTYNYVWLRDEVVIKNYDKAEIFVKDRSTYKILVTNQSGCTTISEPIKLKTCETTTDNRAILINPPPITAEKTSFYTNEKSLLSSDGCSNANLQWLKDTQVIVGATQKTLEVKESGNYTLQIEKFGCVATTNTIKISIETVLGVGEELPEIEIDVYPNPTEDNLIISTSSQINSPITLKMTNILGRLIKNYDFLQAKSQIIDIKTLPEGMYFLIFETNGKRVVKKIIKKD